MNKQHTAESGGREPFRVFFDRTFADTFLLATDAADGDAGQAAQRCATAYGKAFARWSLLGRVGDAQRFIVRQVSSKAKGRKVAAPILEAGVGYKPWVYVRATETGTTRKRALWLFSSAAATLVLALGAIGLATPASTDNRVSIEGGQDNPTPASETTSTTTTTTTTTTVPPSTSVPEDDDTWTGFTLDLSDLPSSPAEIDAIRPESDGPDLIVPTRRATPAPALAPTTSITRPTSVPPTTLATSTTLPPVTTTTTAAPRTTTTTTTSTTTTTTSTTSTVPTTTTTTTVTPTPTTTVAPTTTLSPKDAAKAEREQRKREREDRRRN